MDLKNIFDNNFIDLNSIFDSVHEGVVISSSLKDFLYWNLAAKKILENEPDNTDATQWAERYRLYDPVTEDYLAYNDLPMIRALNGEEFSDYRVLTKSLSHPNGIILSVNGKPLKSGHATIGGITTFRDITHQVKLEKETKSERNFYERILDLMPGIVFIKDLEGKFIYGNKSFHEILGEKSVIGKSSDDFLVSEMAKKVYAHDKIVLDTRQSHEFEEIIHWKDGTKSTFLTTRFPYYSDEHELKGICAVSKDITKEIQINTDLEQERNRSALVSKHAAIGVLSAEIAHEIKNPLTILQTASDVLRVVLEDEKIDRNLIREKLKVINETISRMNLVASSLGNLSKDGSLIKDSTTTVRELLDNIKALYSFKTRKFKMEILFEESEALDLKVTCNQVQISEVLLNLLMNALDAVEEVNYPEIIVKTSQVDNYLVIKVSDNGKGVQEDIRQKIFEPFFTTKGDQNGMGLGLSISKKIVEKHNGSLYYEESESGHSFVVKIPVR